MQLLNRFDFVVSRRLLDEGAEVMDKARAASQRLESESPALV